MSLPMPVCCLQPQSRQSSLSVERWWLCRYLYILSKVSLLPVFLSFLSTPLGFTRQTLGATYVHLLLAGDHSPLPITLPSAVSELFSGISSVSLHISTATKCVKCFIEHVLHIVPGVRMHNLRAGPNKKTFYKHTYIHLPRFRLHTARSLASLPTQQLASRHPFCYSQEHDYHRGRWSSYLLPILTFPSY